MEKIPLSAVPNQTLTITLNDRLFEINVLTGQSGSTLVDVTVDGKNLVRGYRAVHAADLLPMPLPVKYGYLVFFCDNGASYPDYTQFELSHGLYWWEA